MECNGKSRAMGVQHPTGPMTVGELLEHLLAMADQHEDLLAAPVAIDTSVVDTILLRSIKLVAGKGPRRVVVLSSEEVPDFS